MTPRSPRNVGPVFSGKDPNLGCRGVQSLYSFPSMAKSGLGVLGFVLRLSPKGALAVDFLDRGRPAHESDGPGALEKRAPSPAPGPQPSHGWLLLPPLVPCSFQELLELVLADFLPTLLDDAPHAIPPFIRTLVSSQHRATRTKQDDSSRTHAFSRKGYMVGEPSRPPPPRVGRSPRFPPVGSGTSPADTGGCGSSAPRVSRPWR